MPDAELLQILIHKRDLWVQWRTDHPAEIPCLRDADLSSADLRGVDLSACDLRGANLVGALLRGANLRRSDLSSADLEMTDASEVIFSQAVLRKACLRNANLSRSILRRVDLSDADLSGADLSDAVLQQAILVSTNLDGAILRNCRVYGVSAWDIKTNEATIQHDLVVTRHPDSIITTDNLELAQFIYLLLNNQNLRSIIDVITSKVVLILGRFTPSRKAVLDAIRDHLRLRNYVPVVLDFENSESRDTHETLTLLARMARFIIADISDPKSIPQELVSIVEQLPSVPVQPIIATGELPWGMFDHIRRYPWVMELYRYHSTDTVIEEIEAIIHLPEARLLK